MTQFSKVLLVAATMAGVACGDSDGPSASDTGCMGKECNPRDAASQDAKEPASDGGAEEVDAADDDVDGATGTMDAGDGMQAVTIRFKAKLGDQDLVCGQNYTGQGTTGLTATPKDFRFYVQEVRLVRKGTTQEERVVFDALPPFQSKDVALIDFTDAKGSCGGNGGSVVNTTIRGRVPVGEYDGIVFVNGVPEELNHAGPAETATAPLDDVTLFWNWLGGYRFVVAELQAVSTGHDAGTLDAGAHDAGSADASDHDASTPDAGLDDAATHGGDAGTVHDAGAADGGHGGSDAGGGGGHGTSSAAALHIGSSACTGTPAAGFTCTRQARTQIRLMSFNPSTNNVVADLAAVFKTSDLTMPPQCHGTAPECIAPYAAFGVDMNTGMPTAAQQVYRVE